MMEKKKLILAGALLIWIFGAIYLWSKTVEELHSDKQPVGDSLTLKYIIFPSLRDD